MTEEGDMKRWMWITVIVVVCILAAISGGGYLWLQWRLSKELPQINGEIALNGIRENIEIIRDEWGVPHIYAQNEKDLYFAFGYAMAQDRLWQMDFHRRLGKGALSEILGKKFIAVDRYFRTIAAAGADTSVSEKIAPLLDAFSEGINAFMDSHKGRLPIEFTILGFRPSPWTPEDYIAVLKVVNWALSSGWRVDMTARRMLEKVGEERLKEAFPGWPGDAPIVIKNEKLLKAGIDRTQEVLALLDGIFPLGGSGASNNWVVSGDKSLSCKPILANDPHVSLTNPSFWWEVHLSCPTIDVTGFAVTGVPGIPVGHTGSTAWGVTNVMTDDVDFYVEKINSKNAGQYLFNGKWEDMKVIKETIAVKGEAPVVEEIFLTRHGPVIERPDAETAISARWAFSERPQPADPGYLLIKAKTVQEIGMALSRWELPGQNFVFADAGGGIGYWCCSPVVIRAKGEGLLPVPGWTDEYEWKGYVPHEEKPHVINPVNGVIFTANNRLAGEDYPYQITTYWEPADRSLRIKELLGAKEKFAPSDFMAIQMDVLSVLARRINPLMTEAVKDAFPDQKASELKAILSSWDCRMEKESVAASIFEVFFIHLLDAVFKDELGDELYAAYLKTVSFPARAIEAMAEADKCLFCDDISTPVKETFRDAAAKALKNAVTEIEGKLGSDMKKWYWGSLHALTFEHPLGKKRPLDLIFNLGPFPVEGSPLTINKKQYQYNNPYSCNHGVSMRMIVDLALPDGAYHVLPTGESGHIKSPHHTDQIPLYLEGKYRTAPFARPEVEKKKEAYLILKPEASR